MRALLLSGGIDSSALAFWQRPDVAVTIDYGQKPAHAEIDAASEICRTLDLRHEIIRVDCSSLGTGNLAGQPVSSLSEAPEWWPFRNQLLVTLAGMKLVTKGLAEIIIGTVRGDSDVHADGRAEFISCLDAIMRVQEGGVRVTAPAIKLSSEELLSCSGATADLLGWTFSCHVSEYACGQCRGCTKHLNAIQWFLRKAR